MSEKQFGKINNIHFIGIGGVGMSGIARVLLTMGYNVSGSDLKDSELTRALAKMGASVYRGHSRQNIGAAQVVVTSSAIAEANPEYLEAVDNNIPVITRGEMLAELMRLKYGLAVAGTHGKTTTTALTAAVCQAGGKSPTAVIGGKWRNIGSNAELGQSRYLVCEADESDGSFLKLSPVISIVTNIDSDHMDYYKTEANLRLNFLTFINKTPFYGKAIICIDDPVLTEMLAEIKKPYITYGFSSQADIRAYDVKAVAQGMQYKVRAHNRELGVFQLNIPGEHNVLNSLAAVAAGMELDINVNTIQNSLREFQGVNRRMQFKGKWRNFRVMDDYAHHPTEIKATLKALKKQAARLVVIFQPHRYSRTLALHAEFARSFTDVDELYLMDIFPAGEKTLPGVSSALIYEKCRAPANIHYCSDRKQLVDKLKTANRDHSGIILTIGAGDVHKMADLIMN